MAWWFLAILIGLIDCVGYLEPIGRFRMASIEEMNSLREVIAALFHRKFYLPWWEHDMWWRCRPKRVPIRKLRLLSWYYLRRNSNLYDILFFVNPTVLLTMSFGGGVVARKYLTCARERSRGRTLRRSRTRPRLGTTNMLEWVHTTFKHQNDLLYACMHRNQRC